MRVDHRAEALPEQGDADVGLGEKGVAVAMGHARLLAADAELLGAERLDVAVFGQRLVEELERQLRGLDGSERFEDGNVHEPVLHGGIGGDVGIVAILRGVGAGYEKRLVRRGPVGVLDRVGFGLVFDELRQGIFHISERTAAAAVGKLLADEGIEAHPAGAEKGMAVDGAVVEAAHRALVENAQGAGGVERYLQMACQSVARAAGQDGQRRARVDDGARHLVDRSVAAHGRHDVDALACGAGSHFGRVARILGAADVVVVFLFVEQAADGRPDAVLAPRARDGVDHKKNAFLLHKCLATKQK